MAESAAAGLPLGEREFVVTCSFLALGDFAALASSCKRFASACASVHVLEQAVEVAVLAGMNPRVPATLIAAHPSLRFSLRYRHAARESSAAFRQPLGDREARRLARLIESNGRLRFLRLFKGDLSLEAMRDVVAAVVQSRSLYELQLWGNERAPCACVKPVLAASSLRVLSLHHNAIDDDGVASLCAGLARQTQCALTALYLGNNCIGDAGAARIAHALANNTSLAYLGLSVNRIGDDGASALAGLLKTNCTLRALYLSWNSIADAGGRALLQALDSNRVLGQLLLTGNDGIDVALGYVIEEATRLPRRRIGQAAPLPGDLYAPALVANA